MKILAIIAAGIVVAVLVLFVVLGRVSKNGQAPGLVDGRLAPCPDSPNCVVSDHPGQEGHTVEPLDVADMEHDEAWNALRQAVTRTGGVIVADTGGYLAAEYTSNVFGFVDDLEARLDAEAGVIHLRSASRVGKNDFGANAGRVAALRAAVSAKTGT
jgi:uncharacterized protein (DUF1499 family)